MAPSSPTSAYDDMIQACITAAGFMWIGVTGIASFSSLAPYSERYDGTGGVRQFVRNPPIQSVSLLQVDTLVIPLSPDYVQPGYVIDGSLKSISVIGGYHLSRGIQNVLVTYMAGYAQVPADIVQANTEQVAVNFSRRNWLDKASESLSGVGTTTYHDWELTPSVQSCLNRYTRSALV